MRCRIAVHLYRFGRELGVQQFYRISVEKGFNRARKVKNALHSIEHVADRIIRGTLSVFTGQIATLIIGFVLAPILVRILGQSGYGDYAVILSILTILLVFVEAISIGIRKYIVENGATEHWADHVYAFHFRVGIIYNIIIVLVIVILNYLGITNILFGNKFQSYFYVVCLVLVAQSIHYITRYSLLGLYLEHYSETLFAFQRLIFAGLGSLLAYVGYKVTGVFIGMAIAAMTVSVIGLFILRDHIDIWKILSAPPPDFPRRKMLKYTLSNTLLILLFISLYNIDILILSYFEESRTVGIYKAALVVAEYLLFAPIAIQTAYIHSSSELWSKGDIDRINQLASLTTRYTAVLSLLLLVGIAILAEPFIVTYFGENFKPAILPLLILLPGTLGWALSQPIYAIGQGKGNLRLLIISTSTAALLNLCLNLVLIPTYGMYGAAIATSIGYGSMLVFHVISAREIGFDPVSDLRAGRILFNGIITGLIIYSLTTVIVSRLLSLLIIPLIGFMVYGMLTLRTATIEPAEILQITDNFPKPVNRYIEIIIKYTA
jgi:O-antigen/teichoic acid export membrane protein